MDISDIFEEEPAQWGLRGDPWLWRELKSQFVGVAMPETPEALRVLIEEEYERSTGNPISYEKRFVVDRFDHGGMSGGGISPEFWVQRAIPLLVSRHREL